MATRRRRQDHLQQLVVLSFDHPQVTADTEWSFYKVPAGKRLRVDKVEYLNPTGLAEDNDNHFTLSLRKSTGPTAMASLSTDANLDPDTGASIAANTFTTLTLSATDADRVAPAGDVLSLLADEGGTATLPAGRLVVHGRFV